jgi:hypothetical protein
VRKVLPLIIGFALFLSFPSTVLSLYETITIKHTVQSDNIFDVTPIAIGNFANTLPVEIASIYLKNNTRDGYKLTLKTTHGALHSAHSDDGEVDIDYQFSTQFIGINHIPGDNAGDVTTNVGAFQTLNVPTTPPVVETLILGANEQLSGAYLIDKPTEINFKLRVTLVTDDFVLMAGTYSDTITIEYTDL